MLMTVAEPMMVRRHRLLIELVIGEAMMLCVISVISLTHIALYCFPMCLQQTLLKTIGILGNKYIFILITNEITSIV